MFDYSFLRRSSAALQRQYLVLALALAWPMSHACAKNLVHDGGFEVPATPAGGYTLYTPGSSTVMIGPWTVIGPNGTAQVATVSTSFSQDGIIFAAKRSTAYADLTGNSNVASGVAQAVPTVVGVRYKLSFSVGAVYDPNGIFAVSSTVMVYNGQTLLMTAVNAQKAASPMQRWKTFSAVFTATAPTTTLSFVNGNIYDYKHQNCGLDSVSLVAMSAAAH